MNCPAKWILSALLVFIAVYGAVAQDAAPTPDQILDRYVSALGGKAALEKINSRHYKGTLELVEYSASGTVDYFAKAPNKTISIVDIPGFGTIRNSFDGAAAWIDNPQNGLRVLAGQELEDFRRAADFYAVLKFRELYPKISVKGKEKVGSRDVWTILASPPNGNADELSFDIPTGLLVRAIRTRTVDGVANTTETFYDDYKLVDGVQVVTTQRRVTPQLTTVTRFSDIKHNVPIEDSQFAKP